jgi:hypothetical protein
MVSVAAATAGSGWHDRRAAEGGSGVNWFHRCSCASPGWAHLPDTPGERLQAAGVEQARVRAGSRIVFHARRPR